MLLPVAIRPLSDEARTLHHQILSSNGAKMKLPRRILGRVSCSRLYPAASSAQWPQHKPFQVLAPVSAAPGQILTFFINGINPTSITAVLHQGAAIPAPVIDVRSIATCSGIAVPAQNTCGALTAVTVQIPYELSVLCPLCATPVFFTELVILGNGQSAAIDLNGLADQVHVMTSCDVFLNATGYVAPNNTSGLPCPPMVTHADGTLVTASKPANPGEELTAWVTGLGTTTPPATTGLASAKPLPTAQTFGINFNYTVNALATKPRPAFVSAPTLAPTYSGLAPGYVGLYQINFVVPPGPTNGISRCASPGTFLAGTNPVQSNLTVSFGGTFSFDGAGICVATQIPVD
jgi:uncharacterized protein (TIGR03437 family)